MDADTFGQFFESGILKDAAGVGGGLGEDGEGKVAVFGGWCSVFMVLSFERLGRCGEGGGGRPVLARPRTEKLAS